MLSNITKQILLSQGFTEEQISQLDEQSTSKLDKVSVADLETVTKKELVKSQNRADALAAQLDKKERAAKAKADQDAAHEAKLARKAANIEKAERDKQAAEAARSSKQQQHNTNLLNDWNMAFSLQHNMWNLDQLPSLIMNYSKIEVVDPQDYVNMSEYNASDVDIDKVIIVTLPSVLHFDKVVDLQQVMSDIKKTLVDIYTTLCHQVYVMHKTDADGNETETRITGVQFASQINHFNLSEYNDILTVLDQIISNQDIRNDQGMLELTLSFLHPFYESLYYLTSGVDMTAEEKMVAKIAYINLHDSLIALPIDMLTTLLTSIVREMNRTKSSLNAKAAKVYSILKK